MTSSIYFGSSLLELGLLSSSRPNFALEPVPESGAFRLVHTNLKPHTRVKTHSYFLGARIHKPRSVFAQNAS